jgi:hypothetical protein
MNKQEDLVDCLNTGALFVNPTYALINSNRLDACKVSTNKNPNMILIFYGVVRNIYINIILTSLLISLLIGCNDRREPVNTDDEYYAEQMQDNLLNSSEWLIEHGIKKFSKLGHEGLFKYLVNEWAVQLWIEPWIETERYLAGFWIKANLINHEVLNMHRVKVNDLFYEFWFVRISSKEKDRVNQRTIFYVTSTEEISGEREIVERSDRFIGSYAIEPDTIHFPTENMRIRYELEPWLFPKSYEDTNMPLDKVILEGGKYIVKEYKK